MGRHWKIESRVWRLDMPMIDCLKSIFLQYFFFGKPIRPGFNCSVYKASGKVRSTHRTWKGFHGWDHSVQNLQIRGARKPVTFSLSGRTIREPSFWFFKINCGSWLMSGPSSLLISRWTTTSEAVWCFQSFLHNSLLSFDELVINLQLFSKFNHTWSRG